MKVACLIGVYRADTLHRLTTSDQMLPDQIKIKLVCDLRSVAEAEKAPDKIPNLGSVEH